MRLLSTVKTVVVTGIVLSWVFLAFSEVFVFSFYGQGVWEKLQPCTSLGKNQMCFLLIADPQIIGDKSEPWLGPISRHDSDRFLRISFSYIFSQLKPTAVVLLGDLFDEGSTATALEFKGYSSRFLQIFGDAFNRVPTLAVSGDNDVGGEGAEPVKAEAVSLFNETFNSTGVTIRRVGNIEFILTNWTYEEPPKWTNQAGASKSSFRILVNHIPMLNNRRFHDSVVAVKPDLILSGHTHEASSIECSMADGNHGDQCKFNSYTRPFTVNMRHGPQRLLTEIIVPTCSYRMGTKRHGFGVLQIDEEKGTASYEVVWTPGRLWFLKLYGVWAVFSIFLLILISMSTVLGRSCRWCWPKLPRLCDRRPVPLGFTRL